MTMVWVGTDEGVTGIGEAMAMDHMVMEQMRAKYIGRDIWEMAFPDESPTMQCALYDIAGQALGVPIAPSAYYCNGARVTGRLKIAVRYNPEIEMVKKYRVAIVGGAGSWGRHYTRAYVARPDCDVVLVERAEERGRIFAAHYGIETVYGSVEELLAREVPDVVSAILPVAHTHDVVIACAEAGVKVVSCEKPIDCDLARADETVRICQERGTLFGCGTAMWMWPYIPQASAWIQAGGIGRITGVAIPLGLPMEASGGGCHSLVLMQLVAGLEVEWVEGWTLPPEPGYEAPEAKKKTEVDCPAYGRIGLKGGVVCELPSPRPDLRLACHLGITGSDGQLWLMNEGPVCIHGTGSEATPCRPDFFADSTPDHWITPVVDRLVRGVDSGVLTCTGHDYRQALEIAIALTLSAHNNHQRVDLPLADRTLKLYPSPYRLHGGDVIGWAGNSAAPELA